MAALEHGRVDLFNVYGRAKFRKCKDRGRAFDVMRDMHEAGITLLMMLLVVHIGAAPYLRIVKKDDVLASITTATNN